MTKAEDLPYHKLPQLTGVSQRTFSIKGKYVLHWGLDLKGIGTVYVSAKEVHHYDKFCGECQDQLSVVFDPMHPLEWRTLLRAAVYEARRQNDQHLPTEVSPRRPAAAEDETDL